MDSPLLSPNRNRLIEITPDFLAHDNGSDLLVGYLLIHMTYFPKDNLLYMTYEAYKKEITILQDLLGCKTKRSVENQLNYWLSRSNGYLTRKTLFINNKSQDVLTIRQPPEGEQWLKVSNEIIEYLVNSKVPNILRVYVWLAARQQSFRNPLIFRKTDLAFALGYRHKNVNADTRKRFQDCLDALANLKVIEYSSELFTSEKQGCSRGYRLLYIHSKKEVPSSIAASPVEPPPAPVEEYTSQQKEWLKQNFIDELKEPRPKINDPNMFVFADPEKRFWKPNM